MDIPGEHLVESIRRAAQFVSCFHPLDHIRHMAAAWQREQSPAARAAIGQILANSRMVAYDRRPICQDTGMIVVFLRLGMESRLLGGRPVEDLVNEGVRQAWRDIDNPLRASMVKDALLDRRNTGDNTPAMVHVALMPGRGLEVTLAAKGGGSENKTRFTILRPADSVTDWVVSTMSGLGAGWCPPGLIGLGIGGSSETAMLMAKQSLNAPLDMMDLLARGPANRVEEFRIDLYNRINALGIGAQGLGGMTAVLDVKVATAASHAASKPVALIPQCAANRHVHFHLDGTGPAEFEPPSLSDWPDLGPEAAISGRRVALDGLERATMAGWRAGETLLLSGRLLTGRDAAHQRLASLVARGQPLPVSLQGRMIYYVGPVDPVRDEVIGPAGPTTASRMDDYSEMMLDQGLLGMIGKAERNDATIAALVRHGAVYLTATGGAAYLISRSIRSARVVAFADLGMEAIYEMEVTDLPVTVAVDAHGTSIHRAGPSKWRQPQQVV